MNSMCLVALFAFVAVVSAGNLGPIPVAYSGLPLAYSAHSSPIVSAYSSPIVSAYSAPLLSGVPVVSAYSAPVLSGVENTVVAGPSGTIVSGRTVGAPVLSAW